MKYIFSILALLIFTNSVGVVYALEITVTDNGSGSDNTVIVTENSETVITQQNTAEVQTVVNQTTSTGTNSANFNSGDTAIVTGNSDTIVTIENALNVSSIEETACCGEENSILIDSNGSESRNTVSSIRDTSNSLTVSNTANVKNSVKGTVITGNNNALGNTGSTTIASGSIIASEKISNTPINLIRMHLDDTATSSSIVVASNGSGSINTVFSESKDTIDTHILNSALLSNESDWLLTTGGNNVSWNVGDVAIVTGDISFISEIINGPMNFSYVDIDSCCALSDPDDPDPIEDTPAIGGVSIQRDPIVQVASISIARDAVGSVLGLSDTSGNTYNLWIASFFIMAAGVRLLNLESVIKSSPKDK